MMLIEQQIGLGKQSIRISSGENDGEHTDFREQMLLHNRIEGLLPVEILYENGNRIYEYSVAGMDSLRSFCSNRKVGLEFLCLVLGSLLKSVYHGHEFMLLEDDYVVNPDTVYTDGKDKVGVVYYSGHGKPLRGQLKDLAEFLTDNVDYKDEAAVMLIYTFFMRTKDETCTIEDLLGLIRSHSGKAEEKTGEVLAVNDEPADIPNPAPSRIPQPSAEERAQREAAAMAENPAFKEILPDRKAAEPTLAEIVKMSPKALRIKSLALPAVVVLIIAFVMNLSLMINPRTGRTDVVKGFACIAAGVVLVGAAERKMWEKFSASAKESLRSAAETGDEATVMLCDDGVARYPFSLVSDEYPSIYASKFPFFIGKDPKTADYVLNRAGVSRYHLKVDREGDTYVISDLASTNGTYLNGKRLEPYLAEAVKRGDEVRIGACIFYCN